MTTPPRRTVPDNPPLKAFRLLAGATVIDVPFQVPRGAVVRAATLWPDPTQPTGWGAYPWESGPGRRGFTPAEIDLGDVVGFAADLPAAPPAPIAPGNPYQRPTAPAPAPPASTTVMTWYGYLHAVDPDRIILRGPYHRPEDAYTAAQQALHAQLRAAPPQVDGPRRGRDGTRLAGGETVPVELAQPPASVTITYHDGQATVGDPRHGWIHVDAEDLGAALAHTPAELTALLDARMPGHLGGTEARLTLAALAARHVPDQLADLTEPTPVVVAGPSPLGPSQPHAAPPAPGMDL
ncbi:hypothetical protein [Frankia sp. CiP3]|uniref:hypothetical protein n=1 Tax=Frankia sp. CiP3 TaxID=2880971 RepID=UPI001EF6335D|nr:hypothetical protein [Frankia sp. CiP3]